MESGIQRTVSWAWRIALAAGAATFAAQHASAQTDFELRWGGLVHDVISSDGLEGWTAEDGGRIRHRSSTGTWTFQSVPAEVKDTLRRVHFLADRLHGWAVGQNGWVVRTTDGGANWSVIYRMPSVTDDTPGGSEWEDLWDIHFLDAQMGWLVGLHWLWTTTDGGASWTPATLIDELGAALVADEIELYTIDVVPGTALSPVPGWTAQPSGMLLGLALSEPGYILRSVDGVTWQVVLDARDICAQLPVCAQVICEDPEPGEEAIVFEPWDVEIGRHPTQPLALVVGGVDNSCGTIFGSLNNGLTWQQEPHECRCPGQPGCINCATNPLYADNPASQTDTWRQRRYFTLYGVGIFDGDNSAVACGYSGQQVIRDPVNRIWKDRSNFTNDPFHAVNSCTLPLFGAEADTGTAASGKAFITGMGGYVRRSTNGGQTWTNDQLGEPWRIRDVWFFDQNTGWMVSQFFRLARTTDGGRTWTPAAPEPSLGTGFLNSIAFSGNGAIGVAVGDIDLRPGPHQDKPKILFTQDGGATPWLEPTIYGLQTGTFSVSLNEVSYVNGQKFWAAGSNGLMVQSSDGGDTWRQFIPPGIPYSEIDDIEFESVAFNDAAKGIFVGHRPGLHGESIAVAYMYRKNAGTVEWVDIAPADPTITTLSDVDILDGTAYVVGERSSPHEGVVLKSVFTGAAFPQLAAMTHPAMPACDVDEDLGKIPVLNEVEIAPDGDLWIAGECGRLWQLVQPGTWTERKSLTDAHVLGLSVPAADTGFLACQRASRTGWSIVRFRP